MKDGLDMALDDVIDSELWGGRGRGRGRGKGFKGSGWDDSVNHRKGLKGYGKKSGWPPREDEKSSEERDGKIDRTLDEVIEEAESVGHIDYRGYKGYRGGKSWEKGQDNGSKGFQSAHGGGYQSSGPGKSTSRGKGPGYGKSRGGGDSQDGDSFSAWSNSWDTASQDKGRGWGHGLGKGRGATSSIPPTWSEHDDWRIDLQEDEDREPGRDRLRSARSRPVASLARPRSWSPEPIRGGAVGNSRSAGIALGTLASGRHAALASLGSDERAWQRVEQAPAGGRRAALRDPAAGAVTNAEQRGLQERHLRGRAAALPAGRWIAAKRAHSESPAVSRSRSRVALPREPQDGRKARANPDASAGEKRVCKRIKVTNVPRDLDLRDIRDAFETETGKVAQCEQEGRTVYMTFAFPGSAKKAIETFDKGELNGKTISVALDP